MRITILKSPQDRNKTIFITRYGKPQELLHRISLIRLLEHKGVNIPQARLEFGGISQKDIQDIFFCEKHGVEYIAQSFVRTKKDVLDVRELLKTGSHCRVIAKIENREGIKNIDEIIKASDGIMIARGDMGVSLPIYQIPIIQKMIIKKCNRAGKFVMLSAESAVGKYPVETVGMMNNIIKFTERFLGIHTDSLHLLTSVWPQGRGLASFGQSQKK